ncbi:MAG: hypothetical protein ACPG4T_19425, partial [Nannocystaceae bacterium]
MLSRLRHVLSGPVYEDAETTRIARILNLILLASIAALSVVTLVRLVLGIPLVFGVAHAMFIFLLMLLLRAVWRGRVFPAGVALVLLGGAIVTATCVAGGGITGTSVSSYLLL